MNKKSALFMFSLVNLLCCGITTSQNTCGASYKGELLEDFHGDRSFVSYDIAQQYMNGDSLSYQDRFCTRNKGSGIIARIISFEDEEDIVLEAINGQVGIQLIHSNEAKPECLYVLNGTIYDGSNYKIKMQIEGIQLGLHLFRRDTAISHLTVPNIGECIHGNLSTFRHLERGGMKISEAFPGKIIQKTVRNKYAGKPHLFGNFDGCMGDSMINGIPLGNAAHENERHDVDPSCHHSFASDCTNTCATTYISLKEDKCVCPDESEIDDVGLCVPSCNCITCQNGGSCIAELGSDAGCKCLTGYKGQHCEEKTHPCVDVICLNGGSCNFHPNGPLCVCLPEFTGSRCEVPVPDDPCKGILCQNNATCENNATDEESYVCSCRIGYYGKFCEFQKPRSSQMAPWTVIALPIVFIVGLTFGITAFVIWKRRSRETSHAPHEPKQAMPHDAESPR